MLHSNINIILVGRYLAIDFCLIHFRQLGSKNTYIHGINEKEYTGPYISKNSFTFNISIHLMDIIHSNAATLQHTR